MAHKQLNTVLRRAAGPPAAQGVTDARLLERYVASRDEAAFAALVLRYGRLVRSVCRQVLRHEQDSADAFQVTFLVFATRAGSILKAASVASWLYGVAFRTAMNARRARTRRVETQREPEGRSREQPVTEAALREVQAILAREVDGLPEKYRAPFVLCCLDGRSKAEAARELGWKEGTVSSRLVRARRELQKRLGLRGVTLSAALCAVELGRAGAAAVQSPLVQGTVRAALAFAAGKPVATDLLSAGAGALARGVLRSMGTTRVKIVTAVLWAVSCVAGAGAVAGMLPGARHPEGPPKPGEAARPGPGPRADRYGDPRPPEAVARVGTVRFRHGGNVLDLGFTLDGKALYSVGNGVRVWDAATGKQLRHVAGEVNAPVWTASCSADARLVATFGPDPQTGTADGPAQVWDAVTGKRAGAFGKGPYAFVLLSPDGKLLATITHGTTVAPAPVVDLWDVANGKRLLSWDLPENKPLRKAAFTRDGKTLVTGSEGGVVCFWEVATGEKRRHVAGLASTVYQFAVSPDGALLATIAHVSGRAGAAGENRIQVWDAGTGKELRRMIVPAKQRWSGWRALAFSADGKLLATPGVEEVRIWDPRTGKELRRVPFAETHVSALAFAPDGKTLAAAGNFIRLFDVTTGKELRRPEGLPGGVSAAALTPDGRTLATMTGGREVVLWDPATGRQRRRLGEQKEWRMHLAGDGGRLFCTDADKTLHVRDLATGKELRRLRGEPFGMTILAVSPDGKLLALGTGGKTVVLVDAGTGKEVRRLESDSRASLWAAFSPDARTLVVVGFDMRAHFWDVAAGKELRKVPLREGTQSPDSGPHCPPALSPDGKYIAFGGGRDHSLVLRDLATGEVVRRIEALPGAQFDDVALLTFAPDGRTLAWAALQDPAVHLVELATGRERHRFRGHAGPIRALTFSPDGRALVSGSEDTTALVWDLTGKFGGKGGPLAPDELETCWTDLAAGDAARAYRAMRRLGASPGEAVSFVRKRLRPAAAGLSEESLARLLAALDGSNFAARQSAQKELEKLGEPAAPACRKALAGKPSLDFRRRLEALLERQAREARHPSPERLRDLRAVEVLERMGTPEAQRVLRIVAAGSPGAWLTREARASLERLAR